MTNLRTCWEIILRSVLNKTHPLICVRTFYWDACLREARSVMHYIYLKRSAKR